MSEKDEETCKEMMKTSGFGWRVSLSIIVGVFWLSFVIIWLFFYAAGFNIYQNIAIFIVSFLVAGGIVGASWAPWGMRHGHEYDTKHSHKHTESDKEESKK